MNKDTIKTLKSLESSIIQRRDEAKKELNSAETELIMVRELIKKMEKADGNIIKEDIPTKFKDSWRHESKVVYLLNKLKEADVKELAEGIHRLEAGSNYNSIYRSVQQTVLKLEKQGKIIGKGDYGKR
ncbi:MAG TPA: hypothetical protein VNX01_13715, partial [Bacteroidia bacterium]|nr:hypothetical protein [Bacteroidia bacterium]